MPNQCHTIIHFHGEEEELSVLYDFMEDTLQLSEKDLNFLPNMPKRLSLTELVGKAGLSDKDYCSDGVVNDFEKYCNRVTVRVQTPWRPVLRMWDAIIKALHLKSIQFCAMAQEPEMVLFVIYDPYKLGDFDENEIIVVNNIETSVKLPLWMDRLIREGCFSRESFLRTVNKYAKKKFTDVRSAIYFAAGHRLGDNLDNYLTVYEHARCNDIEKFD